MNFVFVLIANPAQPILDAALVQTVREQLEAAGAAVGPVDWLAPGIACDLPFEPFLGSFTTVRVTVIDAVALSAEGRRKRLLVADMESTIIENEMLDELAEFLGLRERYWAALDPAELGRMLKRFYENSGDTVHLFGASAMQFVGEGVLGIFADGVNLAMSAPHSLRAAKAALGLRNAAASMADFVQAQFPGRRLPPFEVGIALHGGPVAMMQLDGLLGGSRQLIPVGEAVVDAMAMQRHAPSEHGAITVSIPVLRSITGAVRPVARYLLTLPHRSEPMDVCAVEPLPF